jgi:hypothetical protein
MTVAEELNSDKSGSIRVFRPRFSLQARGIRKRQARWTAP